MQTAVPVHFELPTVRSKQPLVKATMPFHVEVVQNLLSRSEQSTCATASPVCVLSCLLLQAF